LKRLQKVTNKYKLQANFKLNNLKRLSTQYLVQVQ